MKCDRNPCTFPNPCFPGICQKLEQFSAGSGQPLDVLRPGLEAEGFDLSRMLGSSARLLAAVESEKSDQGRFIGRGEGKDGARGGPSS
jgi:hypothetical protein